ncbi:MAG: RNA polymerase sigma factor [Acidobacteriota bacterium]
MTDERKSGKRNASAWPDERLVRECLRGNEEAWAGLVDKYKNLVFSIPIRYGLAREDAADIFQAVWTDLLSELPRLREPRALPAWLMRVSSHKCFHWKRKQSRFLAGEGRVGEIASAEERDNPAEDLLYQVEQEQILREALTEVAPHCRLMLEMLFFKSPPRPYREVARRLGIATGSIGFIRRRCLDRLRRILERKGFRPGGV